MNARAEYLSHYSGAVFRVLEKCENFYTAKVIKPANKKSHAFYQWFFPKGDEIAISINNIGNEFTEYQKINNSNSTKNKNNDKSNSKQKRKRKIC